jgi:NADH:ubiquinone reductase (H+-translocating)
MSIPRRTPDQQDTARHRVVVVGGGFGGIQAVRKLRRARVDVTLIDRRNFHLFQPLLYQVATGALPPSEIAMPLRGIFKRDKNVRVMLAQVTGFDLERRRVLLDELPTSAGPTAVPYDTLIVAAGNHYSYFGHEEWRPFALEIKSLESAVEVRSRILSALEAAELESDEERRRAWLTFVVVGGGPTGVEMAGQIAEITHDTLRRDFRAIDPRAARIVLAEMGDRILATFPPRLSERAARSLTRLGVEPLVGRKVVDIDGESVTLEGGGERERISTRTVVWGAGVAASELAAALADETEAALDSSGRVVVGPTLSLPNHPEVLALGDMAVMSDAEGRPVDLPGVAPVAMQQGRYAARLIRDRLRGKERRPFRYIDKGNLATIGRARAIADVKGLQLSGFLAWLIWLVLHLYYLIGLRNRLLVFIHWTFSFVTRSRGSRLITGEAPAPPRSSVRKAA